MQNNTVGEKPWVHYHILVEPPSSLKKSIIIGWKRSLLWRSKGKNINKISSAERPARKHLATSTDKRVVLYIQIQTGLFLLLHAAGLESSLLRYQSWNGKLWKSDNVTMLLGTGHWTYSMPSYLPPSFVIGKLSFLWHYYHSQMPLNYRPKN